MIKSFKGDADYLYCNEPYKVQSKYRVLWLQNLYAELEKTVILICDMCW